MSTNGGNVILDVDGIHTFYGHIQALKGISLQVREREIVTLIAESHTGKEIAEQLVISEKTVERHRGNILLKLGLRERVGLTPYGIARDFIGA